LVLSSTNLNLDSCLYARNTMNAIITKLIIFPIRSPTMKVECPTVNFAAFKSPAGKNNPIKGVTISLTSAVTSLEAAWPITNAIANPIIPKIIRKSKNSCDRDFFTGGGDSVTTGLY